MNLDISKPKRFVLGNEEDGLLPIPTVTTTDDNAYLQVPQFPRYTLVIDDAEVNLTNVYMEYNEHGLRGPRVEELSMEIPHDEIDHFHHEIFNWARETTDDQHNLLSLRKDLEVCVYHRDTNAYIGEYEFFNCRLISLANSLDDVWHLTVSVENFERRLPGDDPEEPTEQTDE